MAILLLLLLSFLSLSNAQITSTCFKPGSCVDSQFLTFTNVIDSNHCLFDCQASNTTNKCEWFTYYPDTGYCLQFYNCTTLQVTLDCPDCVSGEDDCKPVYECDITGKQCQAVLLNSTTALSSNDCLNYCKEEVNCCEWFTYDGDDGSCFAFTDCMHRVNCESCISGENDCEPVRDVLYEKLFIVGGTNNVTRDVEVLDLNGVYNCSQPGELPIGLSGAAGIYIDNRILVCGGQLNNEINSIVRTCFSYNDTTSVWREEAFRLIDPRANMAAIKIDDNTWWLTGGTNQDSFYSSTELFHALNNTFTRGPTLPRPLAFHCITQVDFQRFMVTGGASVGSLTTSAIYDFARQQWETKAPLPQGRYGHYCGSVITEGSGGNFDVDVITSAGSQTNTHIYSTRTNTWSVGDSHPLNTAFGSSVAFGQSFITLGGDMGDLGIYTYNVSNSGNKWTDMRLKLKYPRQDSAAFLIPNQAYRCQGED